MPICIIPARGGSKRIPRKNIRDFHGVPIISWSIRRALESNCFEHVIVSTDDEQIAEVSLNHGATVPFIRPKFLADDHTATRPVINHAINTLNDMGIDSEYICCLYPTAPFVKSDDISEAYKLLYENNLDFVFTAVEFEAPIDWAFRIQPDNKLKRLDSKSSIIRSQDLPRSFYDAGQFYWGQADSFLKCKDTIESRSRFIEVPSFRAQDIDTEADWHYAEIKFRIMQELEDNSL